VVRVFDEGSSYGESYRWTASCRFIDREEVEIMGVLTAPSPAEWKAVLKCMDGLGVKVVQYKQFRDGVIKVKRRSTRTER